ncbi:hypothetical protein PGT21_002242 [Puccinia graminis f. sp. tritici]|uniref:Uncharacterized protein n=1 Tax=Puccinia graminis f. sp. tritici TaxID=56615 RepID=A0A5B0QEA9_PUCGR|nr:hypothetical protein PGT21_002242 [Puccinia graminis f. sp. tritici]
MPELLICSSFFKDALMNLGLARAYAVFRLSNDARPIEFVSASRNLKGDIFRKRLCNLVLKLVFRVKAASVRGRRVVLVVKLLPPDSETGSGALGFDFAAG